MQTAAAILTKLIFELRPDVQKRIQGIDAQHPEAMAAEIAIVYQGVLAAITKQR